MKPVEFGLHNPAAEQCLDIALIGRAGGHAPGRGMGLRQVSFFEQIRHHITDGSGAHGVFASYGPRRNRLARVDVILNDGVKYLKMAR